MFPFIPLVAPPSTAAHELVNDENETWRYRIGSYRFFYEVDEKESIVYMLAVDARKDSYR